MNAKEKPLFSIIIPCYNSEEYLGRLLNCINNQTYHNLEVILINDGSTDNTKKIMEEFKETSSFKVIIKNKKNEGLGAAINDGLKLVTGEYFTYINSDDMIFNDYIERYVKLFSKSKDIHVIQRNGYMVPEDEIDNIGEKEFPMISDWNTNPFDEDLFYNMLLEANYNFTYVGIRTASFDKVVPNRDIYESRDGQNYQILLPMFYHYKSNYIVDPGIYFVERSKSLSRNYKNEKPGKLYEMYDEYKKIILTTLKKMNLDNYDYLEKMINQKYIVKKLEYATRINNKKDISYYKDQYNKIVSKDNIYELELKKVRNKYPLVSIIIPVYNGSNYMREAIDSALAQDYPNLEIIVVNDGSKDDGKTDEIAKSYGDKIIYYVKENGGVSTALNYGIKKMKGVFFSWLSHDDRYYKNKISTQMNYLINNNLLNKKVITYTNYDVIDENSNVTSETHFEDYKPNKKPELAMLRGLVSGTALLIPISAFEEHGVFDTKYRCVQDYLLFFNFMKTYKFIHIPLVTNSTRVHAGQVTNVNPKVIEENNFLWIKMQEETSDETKIRLSHSLYDFYSSMEKYLEEIADYSHNDYVGAREYSLKKANEYLTNGMKDLKELLEGETQDHIYQVVSNIYNDCHKFIKVDKNYYKLGRDEAKKKMQEIVNNIGLYNIIEYIFLNCSEKKYKIAYFNMLYNIKIKYPYYKIKGISKIKKLYYCYKIFGFKKFIIVSLQTVKNILCRNKYIRYLYDSMRKVLKKIFVRKKKKSK